MTTTITTQEDLYRYIANVVRHYQGDYYVPGIAEVLTNGVSGYPFTIQEGDEEADVTQDAFDAAVSECMDDETTFATLTATPARSIRTTDLEVGSTCTIERDNHNGTTTTALMIVAATDATNHEVTLISTYNKAIYRLSVLDLISVTVKVPALPSTNHVRIPFPIAPGTAHSAEHFISPALASEIVGVAQPSSDGTLGAVFLGDLTLNIVEQFTESNGEEDAYENARAAVLDYVTYASDPLGTVMDLGAQDIEVDENYLESVTNLHDFATCVLYSLADIYLGELLALLWEAAVKGPASLTEAESDEFTETFEQFVNDGDDNLEAYTKALALVTE